jgi:Cys-rich protein (TIGR01571 family)
VKAGDEVEVTDSFDVEGYGEAPQGMFRNHLCDFYESYPFPCILSIFCAPCLLGQVMQRHRLSFVGLPAESRFTKHTCVISLTIYVFCNFLAYATNYSGSLWATLVFVYIVAIWYVVALACTGLYMRKRYKIPTTLCSYDPLDDCFITYFCSFCSVTIDHQSLQSFPTRMVVDLYIDYLNVINTTVILYSPQA